MGASLVEVATAVALVSTDVDLDATVPAPGGTGQAALFAAFPALCVPLRSGAQLLVFVVPLSLLLLAGGRPAVLRRPAVPVRRTLGRAAVLPAAAAGPLRGAPLPGRAAGGAKAGCAGCATPADGGSAAQKTAAPTARNGVRIFEKRIDPL